LPSVSPTPDRAESTALHRRQTTDETQYPILRALYNITFHPLAKVPGPRTWSATRLPFIRALLKGTIVHDIQKLHHQYGPIVRIAPDEVTFSQPQAWNDIFVPRPGGAQFLKDPTWWKAQPGMPESILSAIDVDSHAQIRKTLAPGFTPRALKGQEPFLHRYVNLLVERLRETTADKPEIDIGPWFNFAAFDIFGDLGFGESFGCLENSRYHPWIALLFNSVKAASFVAATRYFPWIEYLLMKCIPPSLRKMQRDHYQQIVDKVQRRLNYELERPDIMSHVIQQGRAKEDDNDEVGGLPTGVVNTTFMVLTTAGSETTATTLTGTMNYLAQHQDSLKKLAGEVRGRFASDSDMTLDALRELPYLDGVLHEGLRLCTPVPWMLPRVVPPGGAAVCGVWLPGGTPVSIQAYAMNRDANYFHRPDAFVPERWLPDATANPDSPFFADQRDTFHPFSLGPRACLGQNLAWAELRLILAKLVWTFDFTLPQDPAKRLDWEDLRTFLLVEKKPIYVEVKLRPEVQAT
jgi:cytochrome P450